MNDRLQYAGSCGCGNDTESCVPLIPHAVPALNGSAAPAMPKRASARPAAKKEPAFVRDARFQVVRDGVTHIVSESYFYKTEPYYTILKYELENRPVLPASSSVLDAYVVPICLERAALAGIPVCEWGISQGYAPLPSILYGLNYYATASDYVVVNDNEKAKETVKHITNKGKYPFCYQKIPDNAVISSCTAIFGRTSTGSGRADRIAEQVYDLFGIPLVSIVLVHAGDDVRLSSLAPTKYSQLSHEERQLLAAFIHNQEFL